jgi:predicted dehydrogenase
MRYMQHLVAKGDIGTPYHFRAQRFQDWGNRNIGWRQVKKLAGSGEIGDMLSHRIDFGHVLFGDLTRLVSHNRRWQDVRDGAPNDLEDWAAAIGEFKNGATGVWESTKQVTGFGEGLNSRDLCEVNGSEASLIYDVRQPHMIRIGKRNGPGEMLFPVPVEFMKHPASARDPHAGDMQRVFRFDQDAEFVDAILNQRPCKPSFWDGARAQAIIDAMLDSAEERAWVPVVYPK